jgi:hypothetical protein
MVDVPAPVIDVGLKLTVTPVGWPVACNPIAPLNPPVTALVIVELPWLPCTTETEAGEADRLKPGAVTVRETVVVCDEAPDAVPVTVMV